MRKSRAASKKAGREEESGSQLLKLRMAATWDNVEKQMGTHRHTDNSSAKHNPNHGLLVGRENITTSSPKNKLGDHGEKRLVLGDKLIALTSLQYNFWFR